MVNLPFKSDIKKVVVLENEVWDETVTKYLPLQILLRYLRSNGADVEIIDLKHPAKYDLPLKFKLLVEADLICYQSTFVYADLNREQALGLMKIPAKTIVGDILSGRFESASSRSLALLNEKEILQMPDHVLVDIYGIGSDHDGIEFELEEDHLNIKNSLKYNVVNLYDIKEKIQEEIEEEKRKYKNCRTTGNKVRILDVYASGRNFSNLKKDMIVDEISYDSIYLPDGEEKGNPLRGIWVMGVDGPVKLLNEGAHENGRIEFTFETNTAECLVREMNSAAGGKIEDETLLDLVTDYIKRSMPRDKEKTIRDHFEMFRNTFGFERRFYRNHFEEKIQKYLNAHQYFSE